MVPSSFSSRRKIPPGERGERGERGVVELEEGGIFRGEMAGPGEVAVLVRGGMIASVFSNRGAEFGEVGVGEEGGRKLFIGRGLFLS